MGNRISSGRKVDIIPCVTYDKIYKCSKECENVNDFRCEKCVSNLVDFDLSKIGRVFLDYGENAEIRYKGQMNDANQWHGLGISYYKCDSTGKNMQAKGLWMNGNYIYGLITREGTKIYQGQMKGRKFYGWGKSYHENGNVFKEGLFQLDDTTYGYMTQYHKDGTKHIEGNFRGGMLNGYGICYYDDGVNKRYEGQFVNSCSEGHGKEYSRTGDLVYEGNYKNGKRFGIGRKYNL